MSTVSADLLRKIASHYDVLTLLGEGGMGTVYRIRHRHLNEIRVAKIMHRSLRGNPQLAERFHREAQLLSGLRHPNIAQIYEFFVNDEGDAAIIMEWVPGEDLRRLSRRLGPVPLDLGLEIGHQTLLALEHLHAQQYVHRDISPDNLMLSWSIEGANLGPTVKMIDLGIAKAIDETAGMTATGNFLGKVRYSSPERLSPDGNLDPRSDLYSLAVVLYEILTGVCPIRGTSPESLISGHLFHHPRPFKESDPDDKIPEPLRDLLMRLLAKDPNGRPASAAALLPEWRDIQKPFPIDVSSPSAWARQIGMGSDLTAEDGNNDETLSLPETFAEAQDSQAQSSPRDIGTTLLDNPTRATPKRSEHLLIWTVGLIALSILGAVAWWVMPSNHISDSQSPPEEQAAVSVDGSSSSAGPAPPDAVRADAALPETALAEAASPLENQPLENPNVAERKPLASDDYPTVSLEAPSAEIESQPNKLPPAPGSLLVTATPWAEVASILGSKGESHALPEDRSTPLALSLLPGRYEIEMVHKGLGQRRQVVVDVVSSSVSRSSVEFEEVDADALLRSMGW